MPTSLWDYSATVEERRAYLAAASPRVPDLPADPNILLCFAAVFSTFSRTWANSDDGSLLSGFTFRSSR